MLLLEDKAGTMTAPSWNCAARTAFPLYARSQRQPTLDLAKKTPFLFSTQSMRSRSPDSFRFPLPLPLLPG